MANTIERDKLIAHRDMLLESYRCELRSLADRVDAAQKRLEAGTIAGPAEPGTPRVFLPTSDHDGFGIQQRAGELIKLAAQVQMVDTVLRSLS